jgi:hypothetical protein
MRSHLSSDAKTLEAREKELGKARDFLKAARKIVKAIRSQDAEIDI